MITHAVLNGDDDDLLQYRIPIPDGWVVEVEALGYEAWAHSPDGEHGVSEVGFTKSEALQKLKKRMEDWLR